MVSLIVMAVHLHLQLIWSSLGWIYIHLKYILAHKHTGQNGKQDLAGTWFIDWRMSKHNIRNLFATNYERGLGKGSITPSL